MSDKIKTPRPWFQFSLRTMLIVMVLVSAVFGYWVHWAKEWKRQRWRAISSGDLYPAWKPKRSVAAPASLWLIGEKGYDELFVVPREPLSNEPRVEEYRRLFPEATVELGDST